MPSARMAEMLLTGGSRDPRLQRLTDHGVPDLSGAPLFGQQGFESGAREFLREEGPSLAGALAGPAGRVIASAPRLSAALLGGGGLFASSSEAGEGSENPLHGLMTDRARLSQMRQDAIARREANRPKGRTPSPQSDPKFTAADNEVKEIDAKMSGLDTMIADLQRRNSPEYQIEVQRMQQQAAEEEQKRRAQTPTRELYSDLTPYLPVASGALGLTMGALLKGRSTKAFNDTLKALSTRWENAVKKGHQAMAKGDRVNAQRFADEARTIKSEFDAAKSAGAGGNIAPTVAGAGTGVFAAFLPEEIDLARAAPGSELQQKLYDSLFSDPKMTLKRAGMGAFFGAFPAEVGGMTTRALMGRAAPAGFAPETVSLSRILKRTAQPQQARTPAPQAMPQASGQAQPKSSMSQQLTQGTTGTTSSSQTSEPIQTPYGLRDPATGRFTKKP